MGGIRTGSLSKVFVAVMSLLTVASVAAGKEVAKASGLRGTTSSMVASGRPGKPPTGGPASLEFAIAPMHDDRPAFQNAIFVRSDAQGKYEVALPPGRYWVGPKAKALDPQHYQPGATTFSEDIIVVRDGFVQLDLVEMSYAP